MYLFSSTILTANTLTFRLHPNGSKLPFLDVEISHSNAKFSTSVYRKPTFTGLFTNFHCFNPLAYKHSLVFCLLHQIFNICSSNENSHIQLEIVRKLFSLNGFPSHMSDHLGRRFLNNVFEPKPTIHTFPKKIIYFCLPFTGSHAISLNSHPNHSTLQCCLSPSQHSICFSLFYTHRFFFFLLRIKYLTF